MSGESGSGERRQPLVADIDVLAPEQIETFYELMNAAPVLMWLGAPDGSCTFLSRSWSERTGQSKVEALGWGWLEAIHPEDRTIVAGAYAEASREKKPYQVEYRLRDRIDGYRWVLDSAAPRLSASGDLLGYVGSLVDNEERKRAELALEHSEPT